jgi:Flp pilus assembly protein TadB
VVDVTAQALLGMGIGAGLAASLALLVAALAGWKPTRRRQTSAGSGRWWGRGAGRRAGLAVVVAVLVAVVTRWPVAVGSVGVLIWLWPTMFGAAAASQRQLVRLESLATWTESLRDTIAGSISLEQAIPATVDAAPPAIQPQLRRLTGMLQARIPLPQSLAAFADDLDDASADLVLAALILNSRLRGPGLVATLSALVVSAREELDMRRRIEAGRRSLRRSAQIVVAVTVVFAAGLAVFSRDYVAPYGTVTGQVMLAVVIAIFATGFMWLRRLADADAPTRFLGDPDQVAAATATGALR